MTDDMDHEGHDKHERLSRLFAEAIELEGDDLARFLAQHSEDSADLRRLLAADRAADSPLDHPPIQQVIGSPKPPEQIGGYRILGDLAVGGSSHVYRAEHVDTGQTVALKVLHPLFVSDRDLQRMRHEAGLLAELQLQGVAEIIEAGSESIGHLGRFVYIATRLVEGRPITTSIQRFSPSGIRDIARLGHEACRVLSRIHAAGLIHRDIKPGNLLVDKLGQPVFIDFGIATRAHDIDMTTTRSGTSIGSPAYMSPEQARGTEIVDHRTDIWSLAMTLYECVTSIRPFERSSLDATRSAIQKAPLPNPALHNSHAHKALRTVLERALERNPAKRYADASEFGDDLGRLSEGLEPHAKPRSTARRAAAFVARHPLVSAALLFLLGLIAYDRSQTARLETAYLLTDQGQAELLREQAEHLWPNRSSTLPAKREWLTKAEELLRRRSRHAGVSARSEHAPHHQATLRELEHLETTRRDILRRIEITEQLAADLNTHRARWKSCLEDLENDELRYKDISLQPQEGLVPLGRDKNSRLWEFWMPETGSEPEWNGPLLSGSMVNPPAASCAVVLVLLPAGSIRHARPADDVILPGMEVNNVEHLDEVASVAAFLLAKHEFSQAQWLRLTGTNPSMYRKENALRSFNLHVDERHPVENVSWQTATDALGKWGLRLPTEHEWLYGCRAGTNSLWYTGNDPRALENIANLSDPGFDRACDYQHLTPRRIQHTDPYPLTGPIGCLEPNPWGFYNMIGNVTEWTSTCWETEYPEHWTKNMRFRLGGSFDMRPIVSWHGYRHRRAKDTYEGSVGFRGATSVERAD